MHRRLALALAGSVGLAACGDAPGEPRGKQLEKAATDLQTNAETAAAKGIEGMARGVEDLAKGLSEMTGRDPTAKPVEPLTIDALKSALPDLSGWERGRPIGERMTSPVNYAEAKVTLTKGDSEINVKIVDSALNQMLVAPFAMFLAVGYEKETDRGYEKGTTIGGYPGWEKWDGEDKAGELNAIVNKRFIVQIEGRNLESMKVLHAVMNSNHLKKLGDSR